MRPLRYHLSLPLVRTLWESSSFGGKTHSCSAREEENCSDDTGAVSVAFSMCVCQEARWHYSRIFQFLCLLSFSLHSIHQVWHGLKRLQKADGLQPLRSAPLPPFCHVSRDFLLPGGVYTHMWRLCIRMKFVVGALHAYAITDALQSEWTDLSVYLQRTIQEAVAVANRYAAEASSSPRRASRSRKQDHENLSSRALLDGVVQLHRQRGYHRDPSCPFSPPHQKDGKARRSRLRRDASAQASAPRTGTPSLAEDHGLRNDSAGAGAGTVDREPARCQGSHGVSSFDYSQPKLDGWSVYELIARHRRTLASIYTR